MKKLIAVIIMSVIWNVAANAAGTEYRMRVDGLACPFCAYGIEKKLSSIDGVEDTHVNIKTGEVIVTMVEGVPLHEDNARKKVKEAGFTLRGFSQRSGGDIHAPE